jgi:hypothetical protein
MAQAELVAQFLCCIPLDAVEVVLGWLRPMLPEQEQAQLLSQVLHFLHTNAAFLCPVWSEQAPGWGGEADVREEL